MDTRSALALLLALATPAALAAPTTDGDISLERGRYMVQMGGCNDCHTDGYAQQGGALPEAAWLTGSAVGFQGPWGTSYAGNLRLYVQRLSEDGWVNQMKQLRSRPPMPWFTLQQMQERDLRAMYRFIHSLGPAGQEAPAGLAPGQAPATPVIVFVPQPPAAP